jgi:hypothetical protein
MVTPIIDATNTDGAVGCAGSCPASDSSSPSAPPSLRDSDMPAAMEGQYR